jgi:hypothetical protein
VEEEVNGKWFSEENNTIDAIKIFHWGRSQCHWGGIGAVTAARSKSGFTIHSFQEQFIIQIVILKIFPRFFCTTSHQDFLFSGLSLTDNKGQ